MIKITTLHVHHAFLYISLQSRNNYDVKWPNFRVFWGRERQGDKFYHLCLNSGAAPLFSSTINSLVLSNWVTKDNREMVWKDAESIFQRHFHGRRRCRIVRSLIFLDRDGYLHCRTMEEKYGLLFCSWEQSCTGKSSMSIFFVFFFLPNLQDHGLLRPRYFAITMATWRNHFSSL